MKAGTNINKVAREFWRIVEVYIFFLISVLGSTGFAKAPSSISAKGKDYRTQNEIVRLVPLQSHAHLIAPPRIISGVFVSTSHGSVQKKDIESSDEEIDRPALLSSLKHPSLFSISCSPFLTPTEFFSRPSQPIVLFPRNITSNQTSHLHALSLPLLI